MTSQPEIEPEIAPAEVVEAATASEPEASAEDDQDDWSDRENLAWQVRNRSGDDIEGGCA